MEHLFYVFRLNGTHRCNQHQCVFPQVLLSFGARPEEMDKENSDMPDYLSDDGNSPVVDAKAMARTDRGEKKSGGWFGAAASFLSNSFYW